jgi:hypothetical protein
MSTRFSEKHVTNHMLLEIFNCSSGLETMSILFERCKFDDDAFDISSKNEDRAITISFSLCTFNKILPSSLALLELARSDYTDIIFSRCDVDLSNSNNKNVIESLLVKNYHVEIDGISMTNVYGTEVVYNPFERKNIISDATGLEVLSIDDLENFENMNDDTSPADSIITPENVHFASAINPYSCSGQHISFMLLFLFNSINPRSFNTSYTSPRPGDVVKTTFITGDKNLMLPNSPQKFHRQKRYTFGIYSIPGHATALIFDNKMKTYSIIDSNSTVYMKDYLTNINIPGYARHRPIGDDTNISIQHDGKIFEGLCASWALYFPFFMLFNPTYTIHTDDDMNDIRKLFRILATIPEHERLKIIYEFIESVRAIVYKMEFYHVIEVLFGISHTCENINKYGKSIVFGKPLSMMIYPNYHIDDHKFGQRYGEMVRGLFTFDMKEIKNFIKSNASQLKKYVARDNIELCKAIDNIDDLYNDYRKQLERDVLSKLNMSGIKRTYGGYSTWLEGVYNFWKF